MQQTEVRYSAYERELLGIVWAIGQWKHYFQGPHPIIIQTDHAPLRHLPNQASVNSRIWKWLSILQSSIVDIQHIPGKSNLADSLSRQSVTDALVKKSSVHDANEAYVEQLPVPEDATDDQIKEALTKLFQRNDEVNSENSVLKMSNKSIDQDQEQVLNQYSSVPSRLSDQAQRSDQDQAKISVLRSGVILDVELKREVHFLLEKESPYMEILTELKEGRVEIKKNKEKF